MSCCLKPCLQSQHVLGTPSAAFVVVACAEGQWQNWCTIGAVDCMAETLVALAAPQTQQQLWQLHAAPRCASPMQSPSQPPQPVRKLAQVCTTPALQPLHNSEELRCCQGQFSVNWLQGLWAFQLLVRALGTVGRAVQRHPTQQSA